MNHIDLYKDPSLINFKEPIVVDFETYYDKNYSLSKITTEEYIRCDKFECIGVSIKVGSQPSKFYREKQGLEIIRNLTKTLPRSPFISHNNTFDMGILGLRYNIHPNFMIDTGIMAKLCGLDRVVGGTSLAKLSAFGVKHGFVRQQKGNTVHNMLGVHRDDMTQKQWEEYADYCCGDSDNAYDLYMDMIDKVPVDELIMSDITTKMWTKPMIDLDVPLLQDYAVQLEDEREQTLSRISGDLGFASTDELHKHLRSPKKFVAILERLGVDVPMKWSEKQEVMIPAIAKTDLEFLELKEHEDKLVRTLVETKLGTMSSMEQTRTATFLSIASRGLMPIPLRYASAHTGRYGGCFVADTKIWVLRAFIADGFYRGFNDWTPQLVNIAEVGKHDLVWNGDDFVAHDGVVCNGVQPIIQYKGLVGTHGHQVFVEGRDDTVDLGYAKEHNLELVVSYAPRTPSPHEMNIDVLYNDEKINYKPYDPIPPELRGKLDTGLTYPDGVCVPVYDILNVGETHRYVANGYLVHNSDKINTQNLSKRSKEPVLRRSMRAMDNHIILASDSSSIEARLLAMVANQQDLVDTFVQGRDVYIEMATKIYNKSYDEIYEVSKKNPTKEGKAMRNMGKGCILGMGYSMSAQKFSDTNKQQGVDIPLEQAQDLVNIYRTTYRMIPAFWRECNRVLDVLYAGGSMWFGGANRDLFYADGSSEFHGRRIPSIRLPNGTYLFYQNLRKEAKDNGQVSYVYDQFKGRDWQSKFIFGGSLTENLVQALAFVILKYQAIEIAKAGVPVNLNVHDEWVSVVPRDQAPQAAVVHYMAMKSVPDYISQGLLDCEVDVGANYADLKTINVGAFL